MGEDKAQLSKLLMGRRVQLAEELSMSFTLSFECNEVVKHVSWKISAIYVVYNVGSSKKQLRCALWVLCLFIA